MDGEVAVYDAKLVSRFHLLRDDDTGMLCTPPMFIAFDVLQFGQREVRGRPLAERRRILEEVVADVDLVLPCRRLPGDGVALTGIGIGLLVLAHRWFGKYEPRPQA